MLQTVLLSAVFIAGLAAIAVGAGLVFLPAGLIVGGSLAVATVYLFVRGGDAQ